MYQRLNNRNHDQLREVKITRNYTKYAEGSVLVEFGDTKVICNASIEKNVPPFLQNKGVGWLSAEYSMLPRSTHTRNKRDSVNGKVNARAQEISRLIGRSLRSCLDFTKLGERQILIDCDVIQADGGTRTASITGSFVALYDVIAKLIASGEIKDNPIKYFMAAISVGIYQNEILADLDYQEDSKCDTDMNLIMSEDLHIIEIQGCAEGKNFSRGELNKLIDVAEGAVSQLIRLQKQVLQLN